MEDKFVEVSPGYLIPIRNIIAVQWKDDKLIIAFDKGGSPSKVEVEDVRGAAQYMYEQLRNLAITYETGPEFETDDGLGG